MDLKSQKYCISQDAFANVKKYDKHRYSLCKIIEIL